MMPSGLTPDLQGMGFNSVNRSYGKMFSPSIFSPSLSSTPFTRNSCYMSSLGFTPVTSGASFTPLSDISISSKFSSFINSPAPIAYGAVPSTDKKKIYVNSSNDLEAISEASRNSGFHYPVSHLFLSSLSPAPFVFIFPLFQTLWTLSSLLRSRASSLHPT